jgi:hypothetical protein
MHAICRLASAGAASLLLIHAAQAQEPKPPIHGLVSMGAYHFVCCGGEPDNTLAKLDAKAGIFGGLVVVATWNQLQPTPASRIGPRNVIERALARVRAYNGRNPQKPLAVRLRIWAGSRRPTGRSRSAERRSRLYTTGRSAPWAASGYRPIGRPGRRCRSSLRHASTRNR